MSRDPIVSTQGYFQEYVEVTLADGVTEQRVRHLAKFGAALLPPDTVDSILSRALKSRGYE